MKPNDDDVLQMVSALMTVMGSLERARRQGDAGTLALLQILATRDRARPSDIAADIGVHQSTVTRQVQALEEEGMVTVTVDPEDRRSCFIALSDPGRAEVQRLTEVGLSRFAAFVSDWDAEDVRTLARLLHRLEQSKAEVNAREPRPRGRNWQRKS